MHEIDLVLHQDHGDAAALVLHLSLPFSHSVERCSVSGGEGDHARLSPSVVSFGDGIELLLTCRVPEHQSDLFAHHSAEKERENMVSVAIFRPAS